MLQIDEIFLFLSLSWLMPIKILLMQLTIYQSFNVNFFLNIIPPINFKNIFYLLIVHKSFSKTLYNII
jgi:hypothetical protein